MTFDKKAYQRDYMARQRANLPTSRPKRMEAALTQLDGMLASSTKDWAQNMRKIISEALTPPKRAMKEMGDE